MGYRMNNRDFLVIKLDCVFTAQLAGYGRLHITTNSKQLKIWPQKFKRNDVTLFEFATAEHVS